jgi:hypothetical protein
MNMAFFAFDEVHLLGDIAMHPPVPRSPRHAALLVLAGTRLRRPLPCGARFSQRLNPFALSKGALAPLEPQRSPLPGTPITALAGASKLPFPS